MAILRKKEIRSLNDAELGKKLAELRLELGKARGSAAVGAAVQNPGRTREVRKTIARIMTIKNLLSEHRVSASRKPGFLDRKKIHQEGVKN